MITIFAASAVAGLRAQKEPVRPTSLNSAIGPAKLKEYSAIRDAKDWMNPKLLIRRDGVEVKTDGRPFDGAVVSTTDLRKTLIDLPVAAWPYGRVVMVSPMHLGPVDRSDDKPIADNLDATLTVLKSLQVTAEKWP
jgi:hypothetical protein